MRSLGYLFRFSKKKIFINTLNKHTEINTKMSSLAIESLGALKADWFSEIEENDTHCFSLKVDEILHQGKSKFQDVLVFKK